MDIHTSMGVRQRETRERIPRTRYTTGTGTRQTDAAEYILLYVHMPSTIHGLESEIIQECNYFIVITGGGVLTLYVQ